MASYEDLFLRTQTVASAHIAIKALVELAFIDPVTQLPNRRALLEVSNALAGLDTTSYSAIMLDLTGFKRVNDQGSHAAGDAALGQVGRTIWSLCPQGEQEPAIPFRYGGDEFCIFVPATRLKSFLSQKNLRHLQWVDFTFNGQPLPFKTSIGVAKADGIASLALLVERADSAAKESKRNSDKVVFWSRRLKSAHQFSTRRKCPTCVATITIDQSQIVFGKAQSLSCPICRNDLS